MTFPVGSDLCEAGAHVSLWNPWRRQEKWHRTDVDPGENSHERDSEPRPAGHHYFGELNDLHIWKYNMKAY